MSNWGPKVLAEEENYKGEKIILTEQSARTLGGLISKRASQRSNLGIFMTLYGQGGVGKTTLAAELYQLGITAYLDAEAGTDSISHLGDEPNLDIYDITNYREFMKACDALPKAIDEGGIANIVVDNLCEIIDRCEDHLGIVGDDSHDLQRYKLMTREIMRRVRFLRELSRTRGVNVILIAWDADEKDGNIVKKDLAFTPALRKEYPGICTIIGHIKPTTDPDVRQIDFASSPKTVSKFKRSANSAAMKVPYKINYRITNLPLVDIIQTIRGKQEWPEKKYGKQQHESDSESGNK